MKLCSASRRTWLEVGLLALSAATAVLVATRHGPLLSPDSVTYYSMGRNLALGRGYVDLTGTPDTTFAPGYPVVLAVGQMLGVGVAATARIVHAALFASLVPLTWTLVRRHTNSKILSLAATTIVVVTPADTFPPAVPAGLMAVAGVNSIELAWQPNTEEDLAGYQVYRSTGGGAPERIAGPVDAPNFSDRTVEIGKKYSYTITSIDRTGNESAHSAAVEVTAQ